MYKASVRKTGFEFDKPPTLDGKFVRFHAERTDSLLRLPFVRPVYKEGNGEIYLTLLEHHPDDAE